MIKSLSIIIPFFNEGDRISENLYKVKKFLQKNKTINFEIIYVNDGSSDTSEEKVKEFKKKIKSKKSIIKLLNLRKNLGKGAALKYGVLKANNTWILTTDIDLSVSLNQFKNWDKKGYINPQAKEIYFGSRELKNSVVKTKFYRKVLGSFFRMFYKFFLNVNLKDTQCGFKLYKKDIAKKIFSSLQSKKFEHDLEIVLLAKKNDYSIVELPIKWVHKPGSKLHIIFDPIKMFFGIIKIWLKYKF